jgi:imidazolonepropionase-like amidohydrolase
MVHIRCIPVLALAASLASGALAAPPPPLALVHATLVDGTGAPARPGTTLLVDHGRIAAIFADGQGELPKGATVRDLAGKFVIPGLVDAHVHLTGAADDISGYRELLGALLAKGVTTVRDMAGDDRLLAYLARETASGALPGPEIFYAALLSGPSFFAEDPRAQGASEGLVLGEAPYMLAFTARSDAALTIAEARGTGATGVKLYANLPASLVEALTKEAHRQGLLVWAHATVFPAKPSDLVAAGADVLSHAAYLVWESAGRVPEDYRVRARGDFHSVRPDDPRLLALDDAMRARGTILDATLVPFVEEARETPERVGGGIVEWSYAATRLAHERGVLIDAGSDSSGLSRDKDGKLAADAVPEVVAEMGELVAHCGFTPLEALHAATEIGAMTVGQVADRGTLVAGKRADLVVLDGDPTVELANLRRIDFVMQAGRVVGAPLPERP